MNLNLRKFTKFVDKTFIEGGREAKKPVVMVSVAAVFKNPWHGKGFIEDLKPEILDLAPKLGDILVPELIKEMESPEKILGIWKGRGCWTFGRNRTRFSFYSYIKVWK